MNKKELINRVSEISGLTRAKSKDAVDAFFEVTKDTLRRGEKVQLIGLGTFESVKRGGRVAKHPRKGTVMDIPERTVPKFKAGKALKDVLNN